jgi:hypothetical protein
VELELIEAVVEQVQAGRLSFREREARSSAACEGGGRVETPHLQLVMETTQNHRGPLSPWWSPQFSAFLARTSYRSRRLKLLGLDPTLSLPTAHVPESEEYDFPPRYGLRTSFLALLLEGVRRYFSIRHLAAIQLKLSAKPWTVSLLDKVSSGTCNRGKQRIRNLVLTDI